jgi:HK97 family phage major capsid protein
MRNMGTEEILAELQGILNTADGRTLTDTEADRYEELEKQLQNATRTDQIKARDRAYRTPAPGQSDGYHGDVNVMDKGLERAFEAYLRTGQPNQDIAGLRVKNEQSEGVSTAGGYLVPTIFRQKIVEVQQAFGGLATEVDTFTTGNGQPVEYPKLDDTDNDGDITPENTVFASGADLVFDTVQLGAYKYTTQGAGSNLPLRVSVELIQDSAFDLTGLITRAFGTRIARKQAAHWTQGTGVSQPQGIVAPSLTADNDLDTADVVDYDDLMDTYDLLDPAYEQNAKWLMKKNTWSQIRSIVDTAGRPLVQDSTSGIGGAPQKTLLGFPVVLDESMPTLSSAGITTPIVFGDLREAYVIRRVAPLAIVVNPYSRANYGQVEYVGWERADGVIQNRSAYVIVRNNT